MRIFKTRAFGRFARKERVEDRALCEAIERAERGNVDADLGGGIVKQRVARPGQGRSGGYRTLIAYRSETRAVFLFGFAKNDLDNIGERDLRDLREAAHAYMQLSEAGIARTVAARKLKEVDCEREEVPQQNLGGRA